MTDNNINWDATAFFASLTEKNKFAKAHDFVFARGSGLNGFEEVLQQLQSATAIVAVSDISQGYIMKAAWVLCVYSKKEDITSCNILFL